MVGSSMGAAVMVVRIVLEAAMVGSSMGAAVMVVRMVLEAARVGSWVLAAVMMVNMIRGLRWWAWCDEPGWSLEQQGQYEGLVRNEVHCEGRGYTVEQRCDDAEGVGHGAEWM